VWETKPATRQPFTAHKMHTIVSYHVNIFKSLRLWDRWAEVNDTWHLACIFCVAGQYRSRILNFGSCTVRGHLNLAQLGEIIHPDWVAYRYSRPSQLYVSIVAHYIMSYHNSTTVTEPVGERLQAGTEDAPVLDRPAPLKRLHDCGARYKYPDLLTYLLMNTGGNCKRGMWLFFTVYDVMLF